MSITNQIETAGEGKPMYTTLTREILDEFLADLQSNASKFKFPEIKEAPAGGIELDELPSGYLYRIDNPGFLCCGLGFVKSFIQARREAGCPDPIIKAMIFITDSDGLKSDTRWHPLHRVTLVPKNEA